MYCDLDIKLPPLRERAEDIPFLIEYFLEQQSTSITHQKLQIILLHSK